MLEYVLHFAQDKQLSIELESRCNRLIEFTQFINDYTVSVKLNRKFVQREVTTDVDIDLSYGWFIIFITNLHHIVNRFTTCNILELHVITYIKMIKVVFFQLYFKISCQITRCCQNKHRHSLFIELLPSSYQILSKQI